MLEGKGSTRRERRQVVEETGRREDKHRKTQAEENTGEGEDRQRRLAAEKQANEEMSTRGGRQGRMPAGEKV